MADAVQKILSVELDATQAINGIVRLNDAIEANNKQMAINRQNMQKNEEEIKNGSKKTQELTEKNLALKKANEQLAIETKELTAEKRVLQKEVQQEIRMQSQEQGSLRALRAELSNLTKQFDSLSRVERENGVRGLELKNKINQVTNEIKSAEYSTERYYRNVGNYQNAILNAIGLNGMWGQSFMSVANITATSSTTITQSFTAIGTSAKALGRSLMALLTNPVFLAIAGLAGAGMAFKWWYDYNMGVAEATRRTREFTQLVGKELSDLRAEIQATANTYGKEFLDVLKAVDTLTAHYKITGKEAIDIINDGFQSGADLNGDMLQKLQQYAPTFHDAGISAEKFMAILQQTRSGKFTEQGLEAIKQGSARIREMSATTRKALQGIGIDVDDMLRKLRSGQIETFDAIQMVANKLKELPDNAQEVGEVMTAVFGRQGKFASQEMIEGIGTMITSLQQLKKTTGEYGELTDQLREKEVELQKAMADTFGTGNEGMEEMTINAQILVKDGLISVVKGFKDVVQWVKRTWNENLILRNVIAGVITLLRATSKVALTPFMMLVNVIKAVIDALSKLSTALDTIRNNIVTAFRGLADIFEGIEYRDFAKIKAGIEKTASGTWKAVKAFGSGIGKAFFEGVSSWGSATIDWFGGFGDVGSWFDDITSSAFETQNFLDRIATNITNTTKNVKNQLESLKNKDKDTDDKDPAPDKPKGSNSGSGKAGKNGDSEAERAEKQRQAQMQALIKKGEELAQKAYEEEAKKTEDGIIEIYTKRADAIKKLFEGIETKSIEEEQALFNAQSQMLQANWTEQNNMLVDFRAKQRKQREDDERKANEMAKKIMQAYMDSTNEGTAEYYRWQLEMLQKEKEAELKIYEDNLFMRNAIVAKYDKQEQDIRREQAQKIIEIEQTKYEAIGAVTGALGEMVGAFGEQSKEAVALSKALALAEVMINQAIAISGAVAKATTDPTNFTVFGMVATIATAIASVIGAMAQAFSSLNSAKFATGGYIQGAGTSTSDSIPVRVSNGESVMNANTTAMFSGLLSSLNQLGGGVPIQVSQTAQSVRGEDMLARAFARGVAMLPNPVVSVVDINQGQRQVQVLNDRARL